MLFVVGVNIWSTWGREGFIDKVFFSMGDSNDLNERQDSR